MPTDWPIHKTVGRVTANKLIFKGSLTITPAICDA